MGIMNHGGITVTQVGVTVTSSGSASAAAALPTTAAGRSPKVVEVVATTIAYIKFGDDTVAATVNDIMVNMHPRRFVVAGMGGHFSVLQETASAKVNIVALEI
jgi:hypothetical protein